MKKENAVQKILEKTRQSYSEAKKQLKIYKWAKEKSRTGFTTLYRDIEREKNDLKEETVKRKKTGERLKRQLEQQKEIDKLKNEFVSLASHQLRTPLTSIKWSSEILLGGSAGELNLKQKKYIEQIYQGNERMLGLVRNLLNVSRIEGGVLAVNPEPTNIRESLKEVIREQTAFAQEKKQKVVIELQEGLPEISTDPELIRMIFQNLFGNAIEYTPTGGKITCTAEKKDKKIIIGIKDTGIGIPQKQQKQIFQKLFRGDDAAKEHVGGTGLELYITKAMVDALSGKIWFESKEDKGTTFWVALPLFGPKIHSGQKIIAKPL
jgi:signal transduction histidine kinase